MRRERMTNPFMQYKQQSINTMSSGELVVTLFEEVYKDLLRTSMLMKEEKFEEARAFSEKAKKIFSHLITALDFKIEISQNLYQLYNFFNQEIIAAEIRRSATPIDEILPLISDLKNTWSEAEKLVHMQR